MDFWVEGVFLPQHFWLQVLEAKVNRGGNCYLMCLGNASSPGAWMGRDRWWNSLSCHGSVSFWILTSLSLGFSLCGCKGGLHAHDFMTLPGGRDTLPPLLSSVDLIPSRDSGEPCLDPVPISESLTGATELDYFAHPETCAHPWEGGRHFGWWLCSQRAYLKCGLLSKENPQKLLWQGILDFFGCQVTSGHDMF